MLLPFQSPAGAPRGGGGTVTLPAGAYWIGDPCYLPYGRAPLWSTGTDHGDGIYHDGDGIYHDGDGNEYPVDSGQLGIAQRALGKPNPPRWPPDPSASNAVAAEADGEGVRLIERRPDQP